MSPPTEMKASQVAVSRHSVDSVFPRILDRRYAVVRPNFPLITVLYLLKLQELAAVPLTSDNRNESRAVFGFSCLEQMVKMGPERFASFLQEPCERAANQLNFLTTDRDLGDLLDSFSTRRTGFVVVRAPDSNGRRSLVTLADVLKLYANRTIRTDLMTQDVASSIFPMPGSASVREALQAMLDHHYRRVFVSEDGCYISDRTIMDHILDPWALAELQEDPRQDSLATPIDELWSVSPIPVGHRVNLRDAAMKLREHRGGCLVTQGGKVITPWDLVMKPWLSGELVIA